MDLVLLVATNADNKRSSHLNCNLLKGKPLIYIYIYNFLFQSNWCHHPPRLGQKKNDSIYLCTLDHFSIPGINLLLRLRVSELSLPTGSILRRIGAEVFLAVSTGYFMELFGVLLLFMQENLLFI